MSDRAYCYPNTDILKNKPGIKDKDKLLRAEIKLTGNRMSELQKDPIKGRFDFDHLKKIHKHIFQDLYDWAGQTRTVNIGKGNMFCMVQYINSYADSIFSKFAKDCIAAKSNHETFVKTFAGYYADMNALHPFREGNGRSQREFARELCLHCGYSFDLSDTNHNEMLYASKLSFDIGDNSSLEAIFSKAIKPITSQQQLKQQLDEKIVTLSHDDVPEPQSTKKEHTPMRDKEKSTMTRGEMYEILRKVNIDNSIKNTYGKTRFIMNLMDRVHNLPARWENGDARKQSVSLDKDLILKQDVINMLDKENTSAERVPIIKKITSFIQEDPSTAKPTPGQNRSIPKSEFPQFMQDGYTGNVPYGDSPSL